MCCAIAKVIPGNMSTLDGSTLHSGTTITLQVRLHVKSMSPLIYLPPANEVCEGYVFTGVCLSTGAGLCPGAGVSVHRGGSLSRGDLCRGGGLRADSTHPTGMHSC